MFNNTISSQSITLVVAFVAALVALRVITAIAYKISYKAGAKAVFAAFKALGEAEEEVKRAKKELENDKEILQKIKEKIFNLTGKETYEHKAHLQNQEIEKTKWVNQSKKNLEAACKAVEAAQIKVYDMK